MKKKKSEYEAIQTETATDANKLNFADSESDDDVLDKEIFRFCPLCNIFIQSNPEFFRDHIDSCFK